MAVFSPSLLSQHVTHVITSPQVPSLHKGYYRGDELVIHAVTPKSDWNHATHFPRTLHNSVLRRILLLQELGNGVKLNVAGALVDGTNLGVAPKLFGEALADEAHAAHPLDGEARDAAGDLRGVELGHGGVADKVLAGLLLAGRVVDEGAGGGDFGVGLGDLVLHALELADQRAKLLAVVPDVADGVFKGAEGEAGHLRGDADAALVEDANGVLVAVAGLAEQVLLGDDDVVKVEDAGGAGADAKLLFLLRNGEAGRVLVDDEGGDALVALAGVEVGKDDEEAGFHGVCDPHLGAANLVAVGRLGRARGHGERVGAGHGLRQAKARDRVGGQLGQILLLQRGGPPLHERRVAEGVVHVDEHRDGGVGARELFDGDDGGGKVHAGAAKLFGDLDAHEPLLKELLDDGRVHGLGLVHVAGAGQHDFGGKLGHGVGHGGLDLGEVRDGRGRDLGDVDVAAGSGGGEGAPGRRNGNGTGDAASGRGHGETLGQNGAAAALESRADGARE
ncbi:hypothetical protein CRV24_009791 [Beauveria bassiana]|nr:hypothetical protein CRV24_009791 [Beauveria bassiana]